MLQNFVETTDNPFDAGKSIVGLSNKKPRNRYQSQGEKLLERIEKENQRTILTVDEILKRLRFIGINIDFDTFLKSTEKK